MRRTCGFLLLLVSASASLGQITWQRSPDNPVLPTWTGEVDDPSGYKYTFSPAVIFDTERKRYAMWFASVAFGFGTSFSISHALSDDGTQWYFRAKNPVMRVGPSGSWDSRAVHTPVVLVRNNEFRMYFTGHDESLNHRIGLATSADGIHWTRHPANPILGPGAPGSWESFSVLEPKVYFDGQQYIMLYSGGQNYTNFDVGLATSADGVNWTKHPGNPVLVRGNPGSWDAASIETNALFSRNGLLYLFYGGGPNTPIGFATSPDGITWTKYPGNPVFFPGPPGSWEERLSAGAILLRDTVLSYWYSGNNVSTGAWQIGYASSVLAPLDVADAPEIPAGYRLFQSYPNPFNPITTIGFELPRQSHVSIRVFDSLGQEVAQLLNAVRDPGRHSVVWDAQNVASGVYWYRMHADGFSSAKKLVLLR